MKSDVDRTSIEGQLAADTAIEETSTKRTVQTRIAEPLSMHKSVELAISILQKLASDGPKGVRELSRELDAPKSTTHRILATFDAHGMVHFDEGTRRYSIGPSLLSLVANYKATDPLLQASTSLLERLSDISGETVELSVLVDHKRMTIFQSVSRSDLKYSTGVGRLAPLHAGSTGRVLLSMLPEDELDAYLSKMSFERLTKNTITDPSVFRGKVEAARVEGGAASWEEGIVGVAGCSVPIRHSLAGAAAIGIYGPATRFTPQKVNSYLRLLREVAEEIQERLELEAGSSSGRGAARSSSEVPRKRGPLLADTLFRIDEDRGGFQ